MFIAAGFIASTVGSQNPGAQWVFVTSYVPVLAPFVMFMRISMGTAAVWEVAVSVVTQLAMICLVSYLGAKIYRMGTLMYGNKPRLKDLLAAFR